MSRAISFLLKALLLGADVLPRQISGLRSIRIYGAERVRRFATKTELRLAAEEYLAHYGYPKRRQVDLVMFFEKGRWVQSAEGEMRGGAENPAIVMWIRPLHSRKSFWNTFYHEMDHVLWALEHDGRFDMWRSYRFQPHEKRARKRARAWWKRKRRKVRSAQEQTNAAPA